MGLDGTSVKDFFEKMSKQPLDYGAIAGSSQFKNLVAELYEHVESENILQKLTY